MQAKVLLFRINEAELMGALITSQSTFGTFQSFKLMYVHILCSGYIELKLYISMNEQTYQSSLHNFRPSINSLGRINGLVLKTKQEMLACIYIFLKFLLY